MTHPLTRFELFCLLGKARREHREATRLFDPVQPERAPEFAERVARLETLFKATDGVTTLPRVDMRWRSTDAPGQRGMEVQRGRRAS